MPAKIRYMQPEASGLPAFSKTARNGMTDDLIRYDVLTQEALRGVIRKVLEEVSIAGLPGDHHFFITFNTNFPGVRLSKRMREKYPDTMTIVIQHSFWNLQISDTGFEVDLTFNDIRERLRVPFAAVQAFFDPSVKFGLQFDIPADGDAADTGEDGEALPVEMPGTAAEEDGGIAAPSDRESASAGGPKGSSAAGEESDDEEKTGEIVSLDSFRKKK